MIQRIVNNEVDQTLDLRANTITQTFQNPNVITHTGTEPPYGYMDWWPTSMWFNHEEGPFTEKDVRWAVSYSIDREQLLDVGLGGSGIITPLPFPQFPAMQPYFDAAEELLAKYTTNEFNPEKAADLMEGVRATRRTARASGSRMASVSRCHFRLAGLQRHRPADCRAVAQGWLRGRVHYTRRHRARAHE